MAEIGIVVRIENSPDGNPDSVASKARNMPACSRRHDQLGVSVCSVLVEVFPGKELA